MGIVEVGQARVYILAYCSLGRAICLLSREMARKLTACVTLKWRSQVLKLRRSVGGRRG